MVKLSDLVHIANNAKTNAQKNAVGEEVKKLIRGKKACHPEQQFFTKVQMNSLKINKATKLRTLGQGVYGSVFYGCLDDECKTQVAIKETKEATARMEYRIAEKLKGMGVPRMYHFKTCEPFDILYFEYIEGQTLQNWMKGKHTSDDYRQLISRLMTNLKKIHEKYPKFRHHDLHWNNVLVLKDNIPIMIDFGLSTIEGIKNPAVESGEFISNGIYSKSPQMYDAHYILSIIYQNTKNQAVRAFIADIFGADFLINNTKWVNPDGRLRSNIDQRYLPTYERILKHSFFQRKKNIIPMVASRKIVLLQKPVVRKIGTASAVRRAKAILEKESEKKKMPLKRPGIALKPKTPVVVAEKPKTPRPRVFINKNGDIKIKKRKCHLYKKEEIAKMFNLNKTMTKEQMCRMLKNYVNV